LSGYDRLRYRPLCIVLVSVSKLRSVSLITTVEVSHSSDRSWKASFSTMPKYRFQFLNVDGILIKVCSVEIDFRSV
jgi:hypothetical protein